MILIKEVMVMVEIFFSRVSLLSAHGSPSDVFTQPSSLLDCCVLRRTCLGVLWHPDSRWWICCATAIIDNLGAASHGMFCLLDEAYPSNTGNGYPAPPWPCDSASINFRNLVHLRARWLFRYGCAFLEAPCSIIVIVSVIWSLTSSQWRSEEVS